MNEPCPAWRIEDFLQKMGCFVSGIRNKEKMLAHLDAYMTVFEFDKLDRCLKKIRRVFSKEQWEAVIRYWESNAYLSPNQLLLSKLARRAVFGI